MHNINVIIKAIDDFLKNKNRLEVSSVEVSNFLDRKGVLKDSSTRKGKYLRDILRRGKIPHAYQIGTRWMIPMSNRKKETLIQADTSIKNSFKGKPHKLKNKLEPIARLISSILENEYKVIANYIFEYKPDWLKSYPIQSELQENWKKVRDVYSDLVDNVFDLENQLLLLNNSMLKRKQSFDIWFLEPYNFAIEFDEKQHFNQFRKISLSHYNHFEVKFNVKFYQNLMKNNFTKAGKSGFSHLKSKDPLFPELLKGERQDNRIRQRAFRDFLKDLIPVSLGFNPTLRIPYHVTKGKIKNFTNEELKSITAYLTKHNIPKELRVKNYLAFYTQAQCCKAHQTLGWQQQVAKFSPIQHKPRQV